MMFISLILVVILIFLNLFIAIILQGYNDTTERNEKMFNSDINEHFRDIWSHYDPDATGFIEIEEFPSFMLELKSPMGWDDTYKDDH